MRTEQNSYNKMGMFTFVASMVASLAVMIYVAFLSGGIDLKEVPDAVKAGTEQNGTEQKTDAPAAPAASPAPATKDGASTESPWVPTAALIARGAELFAQNCVNCHGKEGLGNGPASENLSPRPRNLIEGNWKYGGTRLGLMQVLTNGSPGTAMASYSHLALNDRWSLVHYVRSITKTKIVDSDADVAAQAAVLN